jgi:hypothetical protein
MKKLHLFALFAFFVLFHVNGQDKAFILLFDDCEPIIHSLINSIGQDLPYGARLHDDSGRYIINSTYTVLLTSPKAQAEYGYRIDDSKKIVESTFAVSLRGLQYFIAEEMKKNWDNKLRAMGAEFVTKHEAEYVEVMEYIYNGFNIQLCFIPKMASIGFSIVKD